MPPAIAAHLRTCATCTRLWRALSSPAADLDGLYAPVPPPPALWRQVLRATTRTGRGPSPWLGLAAGVAVALLVTFGVTGAAGRTAARADEATLMATVWADHPAVAGYASEAIGGGPWPLAMHGAALVCRLRDGHWLVSVLVHDVPAGTRLRERVDAGGSELTRLLRPVAHTVVDVAGLPGTAGPVKSVSLWAVGAGGKAREVATWRVALRPTPGGTTAKAGRPTGVWTG